MRRVTSWEGEPSVQPEFAVGVIPVKVKVLPQEGQTVADDGRSANLGGGVDVALPANLYLIGTGRGIHAAFTRDKVAVQLEVLG